jgi:hypothetical protein
MASNSTYPATLPTDIVIRSGAQEGSWQPNPAQAAANWTTYMNLVKAIPQAGLA